MLIKSYSVAMVICNGSSVDSKHMLVICAVALVSKIFKHSIFNLEKLGVVDTGQVSDCLLKHYMLFNLSKILNQAIVYIDQVHPNMFLFLCQIHATSWTKGSGVESVWHRMGQVCLEFFLCSLAAWCLCFHSQQCQVWSSRHTQGLYEMQDETQYIFGSLYLQEEHLFCYAFMVIRFL